MSKPRKVFAVAALVALAWAVAPVAEAQPPIRIGASASKTGAYAAEGQERLRGYQLCVKHTNDKGGVLGRKVDLVAEDDRSEPATAVAIYEKLITQDKVDLVLGPFSSAITEPVADVTEKYRMPMVAAGASTTSIFKKETRWITFGFSNHQRLPAVAHTEEGDTIRISSALAATRPERRLYEED